ncbi:MAG: TonB-dependent receptor [Arenicellales bacterium]|nr:TonB-dependent receptor [Arenicellales bacterium]
MKKHASLAVLATFPLVFCAPMTQALEPVIVTATRTAQTADQVLAPVTVITRQDIEQSAAQDLGELLAGQTGLEVTRNGGYGKNTSVFLRGTNSGHVLTLVDGVKLYSATIGATAFQFLPLDQIERIEIVRGPRSSLYGSEAVGGVIQVFTRRGDEVVRTNAHAGFGTYNTISAGAEISGPAEGGRFGLSVSALDTDGIDSTVGAQVDRDGYDNAALSARWHSGPSANGEIDLSLLAASGNTEFDNSWVAPTVRHDSDYTVAVAGARWAYFAEDGWISTLQAGQSRDDSDTFSDGALDGRFDTTHNQLGWQIDWPVADMHLLTAGLDYAADSVDSLVSYDASSRDNLGAFGQWQGSYGHQEVVAALRWDDNEQFGSHSTGSMDYALLLDQGLRLNAGYGTAFKAPSFNDLYYPDFGNPDLAVEVSSSIELGLSGGNDNGRWSLRGFRMQIDDLIAFDAVTYAPVNVDEARIDGIELDWVGEWYNWAVATGLTLLDPVDQLTGKQLPRRARQTGHLRAQRDDGPWGYGCNAQYQGSRFDDKDNTVTLDSYLLLDGHLSYRLTPAWSIKAEAGNLLDTEYQTAAGYQELGRTLFVRLAYRDAG